MILEEIGGDDEIRVILIMRGSTYKELPEEVSFSNHLALTVFTYGWSDGQMNRQTSSVMQFLRKYLKCIDMLGKVIPGSAKWRFWGGGGK